MRLRGVLLTSATYGSGKPSHRRPLSADFEHLGRRVLGGKFRPFADVAVMGITNAEETTMSQHSLPVGLALLMGMSCGGGAAFIVWRTFVAIRSGSIWLRGQNVARSDEPTWFWSYVATYLVILGALLYGLGQAVAQ